jgi:ABC-2 type transport system ATP-binding protein
VVLDEPTNGLDPAGIAEMRALVRSLGAEGRTVLLSSHLLDEVEKTCDGCSTSKP